MKKINLIVKGEGLVEKVLHIRAHKVERAVASAADYAEEQILDAEARSITALEAMGKNADDSELIKSAINEYCEALDDKEAWQKKSKQIEELKNALNEEVEEK